MITFITFHNIAKRTRYIEPYRNYKFIKSLYERKCLNKVICYAYDNEIEIPNKYFVSISSYKTVKIIYKILGFISRLFPINQRYYRELIFDYISMLHVGKENEKLIFCSRPLFPKVIEKGKRKDITTCIQATVAHPLFNFAMVKNEEIKFKMRSYGSYTNLKRAKRLSRVFGESDKIFVQHFGNKIFDQKAYLNFINPNKIIRFKNYFPVDKTTYFREEPLKNRNNKFITFLHISHMNLIKGIQYLLEAWSIFNEKCKVDGELVLVGQIDKNIKKIWRKKFKHLPNIEFKGFVENLQSVYLAADIFVCPSVSDAGPTTIMEALSMGLPVICSTNCGHSSLIKNGYNGFTYHFNDVSRLAEIMNWCSVHIDQVVQMGLNAKKSVEDFSIENYVNEIVQKLKGLL